MRPMVAEPTAARNSCALPVDKAAVHRHEPSERVATRKAPTLTSMSSRRRLRAITSRADFRRLYCARLASQLADGVFQASLAGTVLFNPDRHTDPLAIALGFAALLLPYSVVGPFAGILLDRWARRDVLVTTTIVRAILVAAVAGMIWLGSASGLFLLIALIVVGIGRFYSSGLSAAMPHVTDDEHLVAANSLSATSGTVVYSLGIGCALGLRELFGASDHGYALVAACGVLGYLIATHIASRFSRDYLGPTHHERAKRPRLVAGIQQVLVDLRAGSTHLKQRRPAWTAMLAACLQRVCYGVATMMLLLLYRNYFTDNGLLRAREAGLSQVVVVGALGALVAALLTPAASRGLGSRRWILWLLAGGALTQLVLGAPFSLVFLMPAVFVMGLVAQGTKIVADSTIQQECEDDYRGRVFSFYDTTFNACLVAGMLIAAITLPTNGKSYVVLLGSSIGYAGIAAWYRWTSIPKTKSADPAPSVRPALAKAEADVS